ncbi:hypothetical protein [uncultured Clostridium sp.]|uniref:hypothetical protein n=1 Tax=uncultured Clostridium sp. TaxID=59620 RepID=UPI00262D8814|nr:hypothetical protein [uncultured Clostridium sp.]
MIFIVYALNDNQVLRNNSKVMSIEEARDELGYQKFYRLKNQKIIRVNPNKLIKNKKLFYKETKPKELTDDELFEKYQDNYVLKKQSYHKTSKLSIERKNNKYGYYNFLTYIDSEDQFKDIVIKDIKEQLNNKKKVGRKKSYDYQIY